MKRSLVLLTGLLAISCSNVDVVAPPPPPTKIASMPAPTDLDIALDGLSEAQIASHIEFLSSDLLEGRAPGTRGEELAIAYITSQMKLAGLQPGAPDGSYFQDVPLMGTKIEAKSPLTLTEADGTVTELAFKDEFVFGTDLDTPGEITQGDLVFVGYGIDAPGFDWDDYKDLDVKGKILIGLVNDPPATSDEPNLFQADTLTYYGRWTYKWEEARRRGALGSFLIHTLPSAGYPYAVVKNGMLREQIQLAIPPENPLHLRGWISQQAAEKIAELSGSSLDDWFRSASKRDFQAKELGLSLDFESGYEIRKFNGTNVVGMIPGQSHPDEAIVFSSHHDHLGIGPADESGDTIYNGAMDNATGVSMMLAVAKALSEFPDGHDRSIYFASVTAEESGLLGAKHFARFPSLPANQMVANINVDGGNIYGKSTDIAGLGSEMSQLSDWYSEAAGEEGLTVTGDSDPGQGYFFRSDQLAFARIGVPALFVRKGSSYVGKPADYIKKEEAAYRLRAYHRPGDEYNADWNVEGMVQQARVTLRLAEKLANSHEWPAWNPGSAFEGARKESGR